MTLITEPTQLVEACRRLANETFLSIDTEFMREKTYYPQLCLIQIAGKKEAIVIDALAEDINLNPVLELMENEAITKVFHACRQDIEIFYNLNHKIPSPIFDTQIGAMVCGYDKLVRQITDIQIDKSSRFTDWSYRPLSKQQIKYALSDVTHLRTVFEALSSQLEKSGRTKWLEEEFKTVLNPETYNTPLDKSWKRLKVKNGQPRFLILIRELCAFREREAQNRNVPRNRIIRDDILLDIAARSPKSPHDLAKVRNLTKQFSQGKLGESILRVVEAANQISDSDAPRLEKSDYFQHQKSALVDLLKVLLKLKSEDFNVAQKLIANSTDLEAIANNNDANVLALTGWRKDIFGDDALLLKTGKIALSASNGKIQLIRL